MWWCAHHYAHKHERAELFVIFLRSPVGFLDLLLGCANLCKSSHRVRLAFHILRRTLILRREIGQVASGACSPSCVRINRDFKREERSYSGFIIPIDIGPILRFRQRKIAEDSKYEHFIMQSGAISRSIERALRTNDKSFSNHLGLDGYLTTRRCSRTWLSDDRSLC